MRVLILGAEHIGLFGITPVLIEKGFDVIIATRNPVKMLSVEHITADIYDKNFKKFVNKICPDVIINMICFNRDEAKWTLELSTNVKQIIFTSTVCVYGGPLANSNISETSEPRPITEYGINKLLAEREFLSQKRIPVTIFRLASTIGPNFPILRQLCIDNESKWLFRVKKNKPVIIADKGEQLWSWCSAYDIGKAYVGAIGNKNCYQKIYNATSPNAITWLDYHHRIASLLGYNLKPFFVPSDALITTNLPTSLLREQARWDQTYDTILISKDIPDFCNFMTFEETFTPCVKNWESLFNYLKITDNENKEEDQLITNWSSLEQR